MPQLPEGPSPSPSVHCKLSFLYPRHREVGVADAEAIHWICCKLGSHDTATPSRRDLEEDRGVVSLCACSAPIFGAVESQPSSKQLLMLSVQGVSPTGSGWGLLGEEQRRLAMQGTCSLIMFVPAPLDVNADPQVSKPHSEIFGWPFCSPLRGCPHLRG